MCISIQDAWTRLLVVCGKIPDQLDNVNMMSHYELILVRELLLYIQLDAIDSVRVISGVYSLFERN